MSYVISMKILPKEYEKESQVDDENETDNWDCGGEYFNTNEHDDYGNGNDEKNVILELSDNLTDREKRILTEHYGLDGRKCKTLEEIGNELGLTKERVRQIEEKGLKKMRALALNKSINQDIYR